MCVIAAVSVVLPWSTCPIVPTFTCGLVRANLPFAIDDSNTRAVRCANPVRLTSFLTAMVLVPMARIERATSPLPRECSTTEPHGHRHGSGYRRERMPRPLTMTFGAGDGNRTRVISLEG